VTIEDVAKRAAQKRAESIARLRPTMQEAKDKAEALLVIRDGIQKREAMLEQEFLVKTGGMQDFWPTPYPLARHMVEMAKIGPGMRVLEPSAGTGRIADAIRQAGTEPACVEFNQACKDVLVAKGYYVNYCDFASFTDDGWDAIVMNPPFTKGRGVEHIRHAYWLLAVGGRLVAIMSEHPFFAQHRHDAEFRVWLSEVGGSSERLPADTFASSGTGVQTRLVTITRRI
jgi:hypothetical protein